MAILFLDTLLLDECYAPALLVKKAQKLRHLSGNYALHAKHEEWNVSLRELGNKYLIRPFQLLVTPICFLVALYASFVYGILYATLGAFPVVFQEHRGYDEVTGALPFLALLGGILLGAPVNFLNQKYYFKCFAANDNRAVPEARLPPMMFGSIIFAGGMFLFAWTANQPFPLYAPLFGAVFIGIGFFTIFQPALNYLVDTFSTYAASAVAAMTFSRSIFAGGFPLFIVPLLHREGVAWGLSIFGFFAVSLIPIPFLFFLYGKRVRAAGYWSKGSV